MLYKMEESNKISPIEEAYGRGYIKDNIISKVAKNASDKIESKLLEQMKKHEIPMNDFANIIVREKDPDGWVHFVYTPEDKTILSISPVKTDMTGNIYRASREIQTYDAGDDNNG